MTTKWLKTSIGPIGLFGILANYGYHHQNYIRSLFEDKKETLPAEPIANYEFPAEFEQKIDSFCEDIERNLSNYPKRVYDRSVEAQGDFTFQKQSGRATGKGVISSPSQEFRMIGEFSNGQLDGMGIVYDQKNRTSYKGVLHKGFIDGLGVWNVEGDFIYKGNFAKSKPSGSGKYTFNDGRECVITGPEKPDGKDFAVCYGKNKALKYKGEWEGSDFNGKGVFYLADGGRYEGDFVEGRMHGDGKLFDKYGDLEYQGEFNNDKKENFLNYFSEPIIAGALVVSYLVIKFLP